MASQASTTQQTDKRHDVPTDKRSDKPSTNLLMYPPGWPPKPAPLNRLTSRLIQPIHLDGRAVGHADILEGPKGRLDGLPLAARLGGEEREGVAEVARDVHCVNK